MDALGAGFTDRLPGVPDNERTIFKGHLFVGDVLLSESADARPSADADDRRQPGARAAGADRSARSAWSRCDDGARRAPPRCARRFDGAAAPRARASRSSTRSPTTTCMRSARPAPTLPLVTAGSGVAHRPAGRTSAAGLLQARADAAQLPRGRRPRGGALGQLLGGDQRAGARTGSKPAAGVRASIRCELAARRRRRRGGAAPGRAAARRRAGAGLRDGRAGRRCKRCRRELGVRARRRRWSSSALARIARGLVERGVRRLVVAGGETSGAVVQALGVRGAAHRPADRSRRAVDRGRRRRAAHRARAQVGQLRRASTSSPRRWRDAGMSESEAARRDLPRSARSIYERGLTHGSDRQHQRAAATTAGCSRPPARTSAGSTRRACPSSTGRASCVSGDAPSKEAFLHLAMYQERAQQRGGRAPAFHAFGGGVGAGGRGPGRRAAAAHGLLRDAHRQPAAGAVLRAGRHGARAGGARLRRQAPRACCSPTTARWWPARRWPRRPTRSRNSKRPRSCSCCCEPAPAPLTPEQIDELRRQLRRRVGDFDTLRGTTPCPASPPTCR